MPHLTSSISYFQQPVRWARVVAPEVAAVTVAVLACFEGGKQVFFKSKYYIEEYDKKHKEK